MSSNANIIMENHQAVCGTVIGTDNIGKHDINEYNTFRKKGRRHINFPINIMEKQGLGVNIDSYVIYKSSINDIQSSSLISIHDTLQSALKSIPKKGKFVIRSPRPETCLECNFMAPNGWFTFFAL